MKLEETISNLKTMLPAKEFILTGSFVLAKYGLRSWDSVQDLDIILVNPEPSVYDLINRMMTDHPAPSTAKCKALSISEEEVVPSPKRRKVTMSDLIYVAKELNSLFALDPKIDINLSENELIKKILEAINLAEEEDDFSNKTDDIISLLKLENKPPKKGMVSKVTKSKTLSIFMFDKVKIDIYIENDFNETTLTVELENKMACKFTLIPHILDAKRSYGRMKDWLQCRDMSRLFFKTEDFTTMLNGSWKSALREEY